MSKNKNFTSEQMAEMLALYIETDSFAAVAATLGLPRQSVKQVIDRQMADPKIKSEYEKRKKSFNDRFADTSERLIHKALEALENAVDKAVDGKRKVSMKELTGAISTLFDKRALVKGESTEAVKITVQLPEDAKKYAE